MLLYIMYCMLCIMLFHSNVITVKLNRCMKLGEVLSVLCKVILWLKKMTLYTPKSSTISCTNIFGLQVIIKYLKPYITDQCEKDDSRKYSLHTSLWKKLSIYVNELVSEVIPTHSGKDVCPCNPIWRKFTKIDGWLKILSQKQVTADNIVFHCIANR